MLYNLRVVRIGSSRFWVELFNTSNEIIDLKGWKLKVGGEEMDVELIDFIINPGEYIILAEDKEALTAGNSNIDPRRVIHCENFNLSKKGFRLFLLDDEKNIVDSIHVTEQSEGTVLSLIDPLKNDHSLSSWEKISEPTPNEINPTEKSRVQLEKGNNQIIYISGVALLILGLVLLIIHRLRKRTVAVS